MPILAVNKRASFDYDIKDRFEAGLVLLGHEVKSIKAGQINLKGSYITLKASGKQLPELYLINSYVPLYQPAGKIKDYQPARSRKLLVKKREIKMLVGKKRELGLTLVPLKIYTKHSLIKLEFALARGKKKADKRETIKKRETERKIRTLIKKKF